MRKFRVEKLVNGKWVKAKEFKVAKGESVKEATMNAFNEVKSFDITVIIRIIELLHILWGLFGNLFSKKKMVVTSTGMFVDNENMYLDD